MDHAEIESQNVVERYLMGKLPPAEAERFEEHYLHCRRCLGELEAAGELRAALRDAAARDAALLVTRVAAARRLGLLARLARFAGSRQAAVLIPVLLVVLVLPTTWLYRQVGERDRQLAGARASVAEWRQRAEAGEGSAAALEAELGRLRSDAAVGRSALEAELGAELESERDRLRRLEATLERALEPQKNLAIVSLGAERSLAGGAPSYRLRLPAEPGWIAFSLELEAGAGDRFRVSLLDAAGEVLWRGEGFEPDALGYLNLSWHSSRLPPGDYQLRVEAAAGTGPPLARYRFRAVASAPGADPEEGSRP